MNDPWQEDQLVAQALRMNWEHARHVEVQRFQVTATYVAIAFGLGYVSIQPGDMIVRTGASVLGVCVTLVFWGMAHKLNSAFINQIRFADLCARQLGIQDPDDGGRYIALHGYLGFPRKAPGRFGFVRRVNVHRMFNWLFALLLMGWLALAGYLLFRFVAPAPSL